MHIFLWRVTSPDLQPHLNLMPVKHMRSVFGVAIAVGVYAPCGSEQALRQGTVRAQ